MKWIAISLLALNIIYWAWSFLHRSDFLDKPKSIAQSSNPVKKETDSALEIQNSGQEVKYRKNLPIKNQNDSFENARDSCYQVGPFEDRDTAKSYADRAVRYASQTAVESHRDERQVYRVQTRFFKEENELLKYKDMLTESNLGGKLIKDDQERYALSLGLFYEETDAVFLFRRARQSVFSGIELRTLTEYVHTYSVKIINVSDSEHQVQKYLQSLIYPPSKPTIEKISCK